MYIHIHIAMCLSGGDPTDTYDARPKRIGGNIRIISLIVIITCLI